MSHLRSIVKKCQDCGKVATVQLFGIRNAEYGYYCQKCGTRASEALEKREQHGEVGAV